jgi:serine/threonine-protein kinase
MIGEVIDGRYRLLRVLGEGGMGAVYEAEHVGTRRHVAVKVILELAKNAGAVRRFEREARAAGSIDTQHIVQVFDTGTDPATNTPYMVMELLKGEDLKALLDRLGPLPQEVALRLVGQACVGLAKAHDAGVVHRDIKPANLFLCTTEDRSVVLKLVDFGVAKLDPAAMSAEDASLTRTGSMLGSPLYMSPEQAISKKTLDRRTDIWSLGVVLYQALVGRVPNADCASLGALVMAICTQAAPSVQDASPWVSPEVAELVARALTIDVEGRLPSAEAMLEIISRLVPRGLAVRADELVPLTAEARAHLAPRFAASVIAATHEGTVPTPAPASDTGRRPAMGAVVAGTLAVAVALALGIGITLKIGGRAPVMTLETPVHSPAPLPSTAPPSTDAPPAPSVTPANAGDTPPAAPTAVQPETKATPFHGGVEGGPTPRAPVEPSAASSPVRATGSAARKPTTLATATGGRKPSVHDGAYAGSADYAGSAPKPPEPAKKTSDDIDIR